MAQPAVVSSANISDGPLTGGQAVDRLTAALLSSAALEAAPTRGPGRPHKSETGVASAVEPEGAPVDAADETSADGSESPEGDNDPEAGDHGTDGESEEGAEDQGDEERYEVRVNGRTDRVTFGELVKGYSREADYRHKTMTLANERKALEAARTSAQDELAMRSQRLDQFLGYAMSSDPILVEAQKVDWEKLSVDDPTRYVQLQAALQKRSQTYQAWQGHQAEQQRSELAAVLTRERDALVTKIPEAGNGDVWPGEERAIMSYLKREGLNDREIGGLWDHRIVVMARKAMLYDRMQAGKPAAQKKVASVPRVVRPGASQPRSTESGRTQELRSRFGKTRSSKDAVALLESQLLGRT